MRCSQILLEVELKKEILQYPQMISAHWSVKLESLSEDKDGVTSQLTDLKSSQPLEVRSQYAVGCDGAGSRTRKFCGREQIGEGLL